MSSEQVWTTALNLSVFEVLAATVEQAEQTIQLTVVPRRTISHKFSEDRHDLFVN